MPRSFDRGDLADDGFTGWVTRAELRSTACAAVPQAAGVYLVWRPSAPDPTFVKVGSGGRFKGKDPNVPVATLAAKWVSQAQVVYLGKADRLRTRLRAYARFGAGDPAAHWGGRYIWQLADADGLLVAWRELTDPDVSARQAEIELLARFAGLHGGRRPFANLTG